jgi:hypothetical protein
LSNCPVWNVPLPIPIHEHGLHLGKLRAADVVRYDTRGREVRYWLKHRSEMRGFLKTMERVVEASAKME